jgi:hypothetical protein
MEGGGGGDEERMHEVAPDLNDAIEEEEEEEEDVDDEEQHQQVAEDESHHQADDEAQKGSFQNGGTAKDAMVESEAKSSRDASSGKTSSSGLVARVPRSSSNFSLRFSITCSSKCVGKCGYAVEGSSRDRRRILSPPFIANASIHLLIEGRSSSAASPGTLPQVCLHVPTIKNSF